MPVREILMMGNPTLKLTAAAIGDPTAPEVAALARDMQDTLVDIKGTGIAAPQVGVSQRLVVYHMPAERIPPGAKQTTLPWTVMVNPVIEPLDDEVRLIWERCLSLPGLYGRVPRHNRVRVRFQTLAGETEERLAGGYHASLLQHECDHLDGFVYPMRMTDMSDLVFASELGVEGLFYRYSPAEFDGQGGENPA